MATRRGKAGGIDGRKPGADHPFLFYDGQAVVEYGICGAGTQWVYSCACGFRTVALIGESAAEQVARVHKGSCAFAHVRHAAQ